MSFATPDEVERAFYRAFENRDLEAMRAVWAPDPGIVCIHPTSKRLLGPQAVMKSWSMIFSGDSRYHFQVEAANKTLGPALAIHAVTEHVSIGEEDAEIHTVLATNVYQLGNDGWHMIVHHASPARILQTMAETPDPVSLH